MTDEFNVAELREVFAAALRAPRDAADILREQLNADAVAEFRAALFAGEAHVGDDH